jgi:hypothetical protein
MTITISKALKLISGDGQESDEPHTSTEYLAAVTLARQALEFTMLWRKGIYFPAFYLLPGEEKE